MKALPYYKMYPADADSDENFRLMTYEQRGLYWTLLDHAWMNGGIPISSEDLMNLLRLTRKDFDRMWPRVAECFPESNGRRINRRQEEERSKAITKSERATESVRTRYERRPSVAPRAVARAESDSVSGSGFDSRGSAEGGDMRAEWDDQWQDFRGKYLAVRQDLIDEDFVKAHHVWRVLDFAQREDSILGIAARRDAGQWDDPQFIPKPEKYLREDRKRKILPRAGQKLSRGEATSLRAMELFKRERGEA